MTKEELLKLEPQKDFVRHHHCDKCGRGKILKHDMGQTLVEFEDRTTWVDAESVYPTK